MSDTVRDPLQEPLPEDEFEILTPTGPGRIRILPSAPDIVAFHDVDQPQKRGELPRAAWQRQVAPLARWLSPADRQQLDELKSYMAELHAVRSRFKAMDHAACKAAELALLRALWQLRPDAPGLLPLVERLEAEPPSAAFQQRAFETMKAIVLCFSVTRAPASELRQTLDGYLSARPVMTELLLSADVLPRTWI